jgi:hypothetical protein
MLWPTEFDRWRMLWPTGSDFHADGAAFHANGADF